MKNYILFDVAEGTQNLGDYIIMKCIMDEMEYLFKGKYITHFSTHTPIARLYQNFRRNMMSRACDKAEKKFICGASTIKQSLMRISPDWNINIFNIKYYRNSITIGVGMDKNAKNMDLYTKYIYKHIFSKEYVHSARDERTTRLLKQLGFKAINTGCPTTWALSKDLCREIPRLKVDNVVFTLTFYNQDRRRDQQLINVLKDNYKKQYFWIQGSEDYEYFMTLDNIDDIKVIAPSIKDYEEVLTQENLEYVGTRLHAGIYAIRYKKRSIIISIDNRAEDMSRTYNLNIITREKLDELDSKINSDFETDIQINDKAIQDWKKQFIEDVLYE